MGFKDEALLKDRKVNWIIPIISTAIIFAPRIKLNKKINIAKKDIP
jgi:hypothetical protein